MTFADAGFAYAGLSIGVFLGTLWRFRRAQRQRLEALHAERWGHIATMDYADLEAYATSEHHLSLITRIAQAQRRLPSLQQALMPLLWLAVGYWSMQGLWWGGAAFVAWVTTPSPLPTVVVDAGPRTGAGLPLAGELTHLIENIMMPMGMLFAFITAISVLFRR